MEGSNSLPLSMEDSHMPVGYQEEGGKGVLQFWIDQHIILTKNLGKLTCWWFKKAQASTKKQRKKKKNYQKVTD